MSAEECRDLCINWNRNPPANLTRLPCVGFETSGTFSGAAGADGSGNGICGLIRTSSIDCPDSYFRREPDRDSANRAYSSSDICRISPLANINTTPPMFCYRIFFGLILSDDCPAVSTCPLTAG